jgi:hypothetical protein
MRIASKHASLEIKNGSHLGIGLLNTKNQFVGHMYLINQHKTIIVHEDKTSRLSTKNHGKKEKEGGKEKQMKKKTILEAVLLNIF